MIDHINQKMTQLAGFLASRPLPLIITPYIKWFIRHYGVNMSEALNEDPASYPTFNDFFTRALKPGIRPVDQAEGLIVSPADGVLSQSGPIQDNKLIQAKGRDYTTAALLADQQEATCFQDGFFSTIYLSPKDYHRVHMPFAGRCYKTTHVPGRLLSVSLDTAENNDQLFAKNERVITYFQTELGKMAVVFVGATIVASVKLAWDGVINPHHGKGEPVSWTYENREPITLEKGEEMGHFQLGSTVIILLEKPKQGGWANVIQPPASVLYGQPLIQYQENL